jgi:hypothetical protein
MARKVEKKAPAAAEQPSAADDIAALQPDASLTVAGRRITIREYGYFEGLKVAHQAAGFIADMHTMCADGDLRFARVRRLFGVHEDVVAAIAAQAADVELDWLRGLGKADSEKFMSTWFTVNVPFFMQEVVVEIMEERHRNLMASRSTGSSSASPHRARRLRPPRAIHRAAAEGLRSRPGTA